MHNSKNDVDFFPVIEEARRYGVFLSVVSVRPVIVYAGSDRLLNDVFSDGTRAFNQIARQIRAPVTFIVAPWWHMPSQRHLWEAIVPQINTLKAEFPRSRFVIACNALDELEFAAQIGIEALHFNQNCLVNPQMFRIMPDIPREFRAICNAKMSSWKGHRLAAEVDGLAFVYSRWGDGGEAYRLELQREMPSAKFLNGPLTDYREVDVPRELNRAFVGLCLSSVEGAMFAAAENLLCGLPVVSVASVGGRDVFFDDRFCKIVATDPGSVRAEVDKLISQNIDRTFIRDETLAKFRPHQARLAAFISAEQHQVGAPAAGEQEVQRLTSIWAGMRWTDIEKMDEAVGLCTQAAMLGRDVSN